MQVFRPFLGVVLAAAMLPATAFAQQTHVISKTALDQAVQQRVSQDEADREALRTFVQNPAVRDVAAKAGLSIDKAAAAVSTLQGDELRSAASRARVVNERLAGGDTVVISTTVIIIILLVVILVAVVAH
jgi:hypothetical protein